MTKLGRSTLLRTVPIDKRIRHFIGGQQHSAVTIPLSCTVPKCYTTCLPCVTASNLEDPSLH